MIFWPRIFCTVGHCHPVNATKTSYIKHIIHVWQIAPLNVKQYPVHPNIDFAKIKELILT